MTFLVGQRDFSLCDLVGPRIFSYSQNHKNYLGAVNIYDWDGDGRDMRGGLKNTVSREGFEKGFYFREGF